MSVASSAGSPTCSPDIMSASASTTSSCLRSLTRMRVCATQACPLFIRLAIFRCLTVRSMSASSRMIAADLPPSSRLTRLSCSPHSVAMCRPDHDGAAGDQRGYELRHDEELRYVPRHDRADDADGGAAHVHLPEKTLS